MDCAPRAGSRDRPRPSPGRTVVLGVSTRTLRDFLRFDAVSFSLSSRDPSCATVRSHCTSGWVVPEEQVTEAERGLHRQRRVGREAGRAPRGVGGAERGRGQSEAAGCRLRALGPAGGLGGWPLSLPARTPASPKRLGGSTHATFACLTTHCDRSALNVSLGGRLVPRVAGTQQSAGLRVCLRAAGQTPFTS